MTFNKQNVCQPQVLAFLLRSLAGQKTRDTIAN